ncbi:MAG: adventurous gliding motility protein GltG [Myxococcota bacterium]|nr:adventurous gliding motility protein GltG [Myxococcota bacterium]
MAVPVRLNVYKGDDLVATKDFDRDYIKIGRLSSAHLVLDDEKVSRIHSVIEVAADGGLSIIDMGSVEGTYVNGKRVTKVGITLGDEIKLGNTTLRVADAVANLQAAAQTASPEVAAADTGKVDVAAALGQAAVGEAAHEEAPPEPAAAAAEPAVDDSFISTQQNAVVAPVEEQPLPAEASRRGRPQREKGSGPLGVELRFLWGDQMVGEFFLHPDAKKGFTVGSAPGVGFVMGDSKLGGPSFEVVKPDGEGFSLRFTNRMKGEITRGDETLDLRGVIESNRASQDGEAFACHLEQDDFAWVDLGGVTVEVCFQPVPKPVFVPWADSVDFTVVNIFLVMFFLAALFVITAMNRELEGDEFADELSSTEARIARLIIKAPDVQKNPLLEKLAQQKEKQSGEKAAKRKGDEGSMGKKEAPKKNAHAAPKGQPSQKDQARMMTDKIFSGKGGLSTVFGSGGLGGELKSAMGNMFGSAPGDSKGFGGLGLRGSGAGGGGTGDTIGIGAIGTKGRGGGTGDYGKGVGVIGGKKSVDIGISSSEAVVMGSLDKELIRQVIHRNRGQIRYCYESLINQYPKLAGKVAVKFVITAAGTVSTSSVAQSTANNATLDQCVAGRVRTWQFPKPKGGGIVVVTYPFIFKQSGE